MAKTKYQEGICERSLFAFILGICPRLKKYIGNLIVIYVARRNGAEIGDCVNMPMALARKANQNLKVGNHSSIQTHMLDTRCPIVIGHHVIIGERVEIITKSHNVDSKDWEHKSYGLFIGDYSWIATRALILPSCRRIERGAVCAAGSIVVKDVKEMAIVSGNPAQELRARKHVHEDLCVESLLCGDLKAYLKTYINKGSR